MAYSVKENRVPRWKQWLMLLVGLGSAGCSAGPVARYYAPAPQEAQTVMYVVDPMADRDGVRGTTHAWPLAAQRMPSVALDLQRCADFAANRERKADARFSMLRLDVDGTLHGSLNDYVGNQYIGTIQDGNGHWYGKKMYRQVSFHCLQDGQGRVVYAFLRAR